MPYYSPQAAFRRGIDLAFGKKQITASVTSALLQGKSIDGISTDLQKRISTMGASSAVRTARTAVTAAQNGGRQDTYTSAKAMGIELKKEWLASLDARTRPAHGAADGQQVDVDEPFIVDGYKMMFPGDKSAPAYLVYNCRCSTVAAIDGVTDRGQRRAKIDGTGEYVVVQDMTYSQWKEWKSASYDGIIKMDKGWKVVADKVTQATIDNIPKVVPHGFTDDMADRLQGAHKAILTKAMKQKKITTEVGAVYDMEMKNLTEITVGVENHIELPSPNENHISIHSHADSLVFSVRDIRTFMNDNKMMMMSVVGYNGTIYTLQRTESYDGFYFWKDFCEVQKKLEEYVKEDNPKKYVNALEQFLKRSEKYGTYFNRFRA